MAVSVRGGVSDVRTEEAEGSGEGSADSFGVRAEGFDLVTSGVVGGDDGLSIAAD